MDQLQSGLASEEPFFPVNRDDVLADRVHMFLVFFSSLPFAPIHGLFHVMYPGAMRFPAHSFLLGVQTAALVLYKTDFRHFDRISHNLQGFVLKYMSVKKAWVYCAEGCSRSVLLIRYCPRQARGPARGACVWLPGSSCSCIHPGCSFFTGSTIRLERDGWAALRCPRD